MRVVRLDELMEYLESIGSYEYAAEMADDPYQDIGVWMSAIETVIEWVKENSVDDSAGEAP